MKKTILAVTGIFFLLASCKEHDTPLDFSPPNYTDTTYVLAAAPAADAHNVLIEEFSGQACANCPNGHTELESIAAGGNVNVISMYISGQVQTIPPTGSVHDLRDATATDISTQIYGGIGSLPNAGIDRVPLSGSLQIDESIWPSMTTTEKSGVDSVNLTVSSTYSAATGKATITTTTTYLYPTTSSQHLSIVLTEDSIIDIQEYPPFTAAYPSGYDSFYVYTGVFRGMATNAPYGDVVLAALTSKEAGRVDKSVYTYTLPTKTPAINPAHCHIVAFISANNGSDIHVLQSAQCKLTP